MMSLHSHHDLSLPFFRHGCSLQVFGSSYQVWNLTCAFRYPLILLKYSCTHENSFTSVKKENQSLELRAKVLKM